MEIRDLQNKIKESSVSSINPFKNATEIMLAITEEVGEVAQEVALFEKVGAKVLWEKEPSKERVGKEIVDLINCIMGLANHYDIDIEKHYLD